MRRAKPDPSSGSSPAEDDAILSGLRSGSKEARAALAGELAGPLLRVARRLVGDQDAQDCVQDALLQAFRNVDRFEGRSSLRTWLYRIVVNAGLQRLRARGRNREDALENPYSEFDASGCRMVADVGDLPGVEDLLLRKETRDCVRAAIDELPADYRAVIVLHHLENHGIGEVADLLDITPGAAKMRLHRARLALAAALEPVFRGACE